MGRSPARAGLVGGERREIERGKLGRGCSQEGRRLQPQIERKLKLGFFGFFWVLGECIFFLVSLLVATTSLFIEIFHGQKFKIIPQLARLFQFNP